MSDKSVQKNVLGENLEECSTDPLTGWLRDGCCNTDEERRSISFNAEIDQNIFDVFK